VSYILKAKDLNCYRSGNTIFQGLNFEIDSGSNIEVIGSNGSGKTSFLRILLGFIPDYEGLVHWSGNEENIDVRYQEKSCFYQGHQTGIKPLLSVYENLKFSSSGFSSSRALIHDSAIRVGLENHLNTPASELSAGQKKRIAIARWLLKDFDLYLVDEPFTALDDEGCDLIKAVMSELNKKGSSFLITGHRNSLLDTEKLILDDLK